MGFNNCYVVYEIVLMKNSKLNWLNILVGLVIEFKIK